MQPPRPVHANHASLPAGTFQPTPQLTKPTSANEPVYKYASSHHSQSPSRGENTYSLTIRQQPRQARMVGSGEKADRRTIDPPPVIKFDLSHSSNTSPTSVDLTLMRSPYFICYATLCEPHQPFTELHGIPHTNKPYMVGNLVTSMFQLREGKEPTENQPGLPEGHYFVFHDLGIRVEGWYRLKFSAHEIVNRKLHYCKSTISEKFHVYPPKNFPGMKGSTDISHFLAKQGMRMRVRSKSLNVPVLPQNFKSAPIASQRLPKRKPSDDGDQPLSPRSSPPKFTHLDDTQPPWYPRPAVIESAPPPAIRAMNEGIRKHPPLPGPDGMLSGHKPDSGSRDSLFAPNPLNP